MEKRFATRLRIHGLQTRICRRNGGGAGFECVLCGEQADRFDWVAITLFDVQEELGDLCDACVKAGPVKVGDRIRTHTADLRKQAQRLDAIAGGLSQVKRADWTTMKEADLVRPKQPQWV